jgi:WXXGXW repeat (2 copies)
MPHRAGMKLGLLSVALSLALWGCVVVPDQRHNPGGVVMVAPPAPREEVIGVAPVQGYVWIGGYWSWVGGRHEWVNGHWAAGRPGYHWIAHIWVRQGDGWRMREGHWERG